MQLGFFSIIISMYIHKLATVFQNLFTSVILFDKFAFKFAILNDYIFYRYNEAENLTS